MNEAQAIDTLRNYADRLVKFHESSDAPDGKIVVGFILPGSFGAGDDFFAAMRTLRTVPPPSDEEIYGVTERHSASQSAEPGSDVSV